MNNALVKRAVPQIRRRAADDDVPVLSRPIDELRLRLRPSKHRRGPRQARHDLVPQRRLLRISWIGAVGGHREGEGRGGEVVDEGARQDRVVEAQDDGRVAAEVGSGVGEAGAEGQRSWRS